MDKPLINQGHSLVRESCKSISNHTFRGLKVAQKKQTTQAGGGEGAFWWAVSEVTHDLQT